jgi:hypothetical protein
LNNMIQLGEGVLDLIRSHRDRLDHAYTGPAGALTQPSAAKFGAGCRNI